MLQADSMWYPSLASALYLVRFMYVSQNSHTPIDPISKFYFSISFNQKPLVQIVKFLNNKLLISIVGNSIYWISGETLAPGRRPFSKLRVQTVYKYRRNTFAFPWEFWRVIKGFRVLHNYY